MGQRDVDPRCQLPAPETCRFCQSHVHYVNNKEIYGRSYGRWPYAYLCSNKECGAFVGVHPNTQIPMGTLADAATRAARKEAHSVFDQIWKTNLMKRGEAYKWLAKRLDIEKWRCHIAWFDTVTCKRVVKVCQPLLQSQNSHISNEEAYRMIAS